MKWIELSVQTPREYVEPLSSIFLRHNRAGIVVEEPGGYNPDEGEYENLMGIFKAIKEGKI